MTPLYLIVGLLAGYWARQTYDKLSALYTERMEAREAKQAGVVRPTHRPVTNLPFTDNSETGGVKRPSPDQIFMANQKARDERLKSA